MSSTRKSLAFIIITALALAAAVGLLTACSAAQAEPETPATELTVTAEGYAEDGPDVFVMFTDQSDNAYTTPVTVKPNSEAIEVELPAEEYNVEVVGVLAGNAIWSAEPQHLSVPEADGTDAEGAAVEVALTKAAPTRDALNALLDDYNLAVEKNFISEDDAKPYIDAINAKIAELDSPEAKAEAEAKAAAETEAQAAASGEGGSAGGAYGDTTDYSQPVDNVDYGNADRTYGTTYSPDYSTEGGGHSVAQKEQAKDNALADSLREMSGQ